MRRMDSEMVLEVADTPERLSYRSVGESSSLTCGIEDKPSSSSQYLEPSARNCSHKMKKYALYDYDGNNAAPMDGDFMLSHSRINHIISGTHDIRKMNSTNCSPESVRIGVLNDNMTNPEMIDSSPESSIPLSCPTRHRGARNKAEKHLSMYNEGIEINKIGIHDFNGDNAVPLDDDFLFSQAEVARFISGSHDTGTTHSHNSSHELGQSNMLNARTGPEMIDLSNGSPSPLPHPTRNRGPIYKEENHLRRQIERNENSHYGKLFVRALNSVEGHGKENASNFSKAFGISNNITETENINCHASVVPTHKELNYPGGQRAPPTSVRNQDTEIRNGSHKVSQAITRQINHNHLGIVLHPRKNGHRMLVRNGCISPSNITRNNNDRRTRDAEEGVIASKIPNTSSSHSTQVDVVLHSKSNGRRILVNDECIYPSNLARNNNDAKARGFEGECTKIPSGKSSKFIHSSSFEARTTDIGKGKKIMNEELANSQHSGNTPSSRRSCLIPVKELSVISEMEYDTGKRINGSGTTHTHAESSSHIPSPFATGKCMSDNLSEMSKGATSFALSIAENPEEAMLQSRKNITQAKNFPLVSDAPQHTGKRKNSFAHSNVGECSSSTASSRTSYGRRSAKPSNSRLIRKRKAVGIDTGLAPIVEIDESNCTTIEENHELSDEYIAKSIQLESDEVLARQLQEQFYLESPPAVATEREVFLPSLEHPRFQHPSARMTARVHGRAETRIGRLRRSISRSNMSLEERLDFLEALEAAFENANDMATPDHFLDGERDFDENDYEMLLALDDNNHHVGASERQINNLPQSLIQQNTDFREACAVCLETPSAGDTIRHLPCLHKFHKDCIDTWLRRKRSCPICKCGIA